MIDFFGKTERKETYLLHTYLSKFGMKINVDI